MINKPDIESLAIVITMALLILTVGIYDDVPKGWLIFAYTAWILHADGLNRWLNK